MKIHSPFVRKPADSIPHIKLSLLDGLIIVGALAFVALVIYGAFFGMPERKAEEPGVVVMLLRYAWPAFMFYVLVDPLLKGDAQEHWHHFKAIRPGTIIQNFLVLAAVASTSAYLSLTFPFLNGSWLNLLPISGDGQVTNINVAPLQLPWVGPIFFVLFWLNVPYFAKVEEKLFRKGTRSWSNAIWRSLAFGLLHCIAGITVATGLALSISGLWFSWNYFRGGEERSTLHHTTYNLVAIGLFGLVMIILTLR